MARDASSVNSARFNSDHRMLRCTPKIVIRKDRHKPTVSNKKAGIYELARSDKYTKKH